VSFGFNAQCRGASDSSLTASAFMENPMLRDMMNDYRTWRRKSATQREVSRLDARLRADIGLPEMGDLTLDGGPVYNELFRRS
jgi:uncharacterized protein YjiS (DUF1127 family)